MSVPRKNEAISKYNIMGNDYVKLDELMVLIGDIQHKTREGVEPGYINEDRGQRIAADLALNHLKVILNKEKIHVDCMMKIMKTRFEREAREQEEKDKGVTNRDTLDDGVTRRDAIEQAEKVIDNAEKCIGKTKALIDEACQEKPKPVKREVRCPGRYTVWYRDDGETTTHCMGFVRFEKGLPVFTNRPCKACWFVWRGAAEKVAEKCGDGFEVVDMWAQMTKEERLLRAIFHEDGMDGEDDEPEYHGDGTRAEDEDWDGADE